MRSFPALLGLLLTFNGLALAIDSYYNAESCGLSNYIDNIKVKRADRIRRKSEKEEIGTETSGGRSSKNTSDNEDEEDDDIMPMKKRQKEAAAWKIKWDEGDEKTLDHDETLTEKVMGGSDAKPGEVPWAVRINTGHGLCGGTLISSRHVITAAHCFLKSSIDGACRFDQMMTDGEIIKKTHLIVGGVCVPNGEDVCSKEYTGKKATIRAVKLKKAFFKDNCSKSLWDVALLELNETISTPHACLPWLHEVDTLVHTQIEVNSFGYGSDPTKGIVTNSRLQKVNMEVPHQPLVCKERYQLSYDWVICTKEKNMKNVCAGDSGGGILAEYTPRYWSKAKDRFLSEKKKRHFLLGIISFGTNCTAALENSAVANAQVNMDVMLYAATINKHILRQTANLRDEWKNK